ncbi:hypothetical protein [Tepidiforma sp.]|uniref:hypothetical protein n=1 Tax=Tepidiforma sp. TaxID=2682230 RepID=UPI002589D642|nr:hypothetical protein [Tepidiforma sp.]
MQELRKQEAVLEKARAEAARVLPAPAAGDAPAYRSLADVARKTGALAAMKELRAASAVVEDADPAALILGKATMTTSAGVPPVKRRGTGAGGVLGGPASAHHRHHPGIPDRPGGGRVSRGDDVHQRRC